MVLGRIRVGTFELSKAKLRADNGGSRRGSGKLRRAVPLRAVVLSIGPAREARNPASWLFRPSRWTSFKWPVETSRRGSPRPSAGSAQPCAAPGLRTSFASTPASLEPRHDRPRLAGSGTSLSAFPRGRSAWGGVVAADVRDRGDLFCRSPRPSFSSLTRLEGPPTSGPIRGSRTPPCNPDRIPRPMASSPSPCRNSGSRWAGKRKQATACTRLDARSTGSLAPGSPQVSCGPLHQ